MGKRAPFAKRLAAQLAKSGFTNIKVIGFSGAVFNLDTTISQRVKTYEESDAKYNINMGSKGMYCIYEVSEGQYRRTEGIDWMTKCTFILSKMACKYTVVQC